MSHWQKKAKVSLSPVFTDTIHSDEASLELSPLTPLSDPDLDKLIIAPPTQPDLYWRRYATQGFQLAGEPEEALIGPEYREPELPSVKQGKLTDGMKKLIKAISTDIILTWPPYPQGSPVNTLLLVNQHSFITQAFNPKLQPMVNEAHNSQHQDAVSLKLQKLLEGASAAVTNRQIFDLFMYNVKKHDNICEDLKQCMTTAQSHASFIKKARLSGRTCRKQAVWIGLEHVPENELERLTGKHLVETPEQGTVGVEHGAFTNEGYICIKDVTHRVCAPTSADTQMRTCIFWTKTSPEDNSPTWDKVFGSIIYNVDQLDTEFGQDNKEVVKDMAATFNAVMLGSSSPLIRGGMVSSGVMTKAVGRTSTYGTPHDVQVIVPKVVSKTPKSGTIGKVVALQQLRLEMREVSSVMQARNFSFLEGFMPTFAKKQMETASTASNAKNILGYPNTSAFGTYAYCASSHTDDDESSTSGWVMSRSHNIKRDESNFVWCSHALVVELAQNAFWFWNAPADKHGTTMNRLALKHPKSYRTYITKEPDMGQWTRASVMTHAVMAADRRQEE